jgi:hypothetical protein
LHSSLQAGTEKRVDNQAGFCDFGSNGVPLFDSGDDSNSGAGFFQPKKILGGVTTDSFGFSEEINRGFETVVLEEARDDKTVAPVVALAAENRCVTRGSVLEEGRTSGGGRR